MTTPSINSLFRTGQSKRGAKPSFHYYDLLHAFWRIGSYRIGRVQLSKELGLGEGSVRTLLSRLRELDRLSVTKAGAKLSPQGNSAFEEFSTKVPIAMEVEPSGLSFNQPSFAICLRGFAKNVTSGVVQRDAALRAGATGATTLVFSRLKLCFPDGRRPPNLNFALLSLQEQIAGLKEGDAVLVGYATEAPMAARGAWAAALSLLEPIL